jgi:hypothetical protein
LGRAAEQAAVVKKRKEESGAKAFFDMGPMPAKPARPSLKKFFASFFQKRSLFLFLCLKLREEGA